MNYKAYQHRLVIRLVLAAVLGIALKYYPGNYRDFFNNSLAGTAYVIFWCILFKILFIKSNNYILIIIVTSATCLLEFLQLWHPPLLEILRSCWLGKVVLGTTFCWKDFIYYFMGAVLAIPSLSKSP